MLLFSAEEKAKRASRGDVDIMESDRRLTDRDISVVASQLGNSWRVLGQRLNFTPETLDAIAESTSVISTENTREQVSAAARMVTDYKTKLTIC